MNFTPFLYSLKINFALDHLFENRTLPFKRFFLILW
nr:MAG TPA: hypothetical protein [Bacteriophage sp.]